MKSIFSSNQLKISVEYKNFQLLWTFLLIVINKVHKQKILFLYSFLQAYVDSYDHVIDNLNRDLANDILLFPNNMINPLKLKEQKITKP